MTFAWAFLSLASIVAHPSLSMRELAHDPVVLEALWRMFERAHYGAGKLEEAAFVIVAPDGTLSLRRWPATGSPHRSSWIGPVPADAVAIVHTHPNGWPRPSPQDHLIAAETRLAVYVITRSGIVKTKGAETITIARAGWWHARQPALDRSMTTSRAHASAATLSGWRASTPRQRSWHR